MTSEDATAWSLTRLNTAFFHHYDRREYDALIELFAPDALYEVRGRKLRGHAEIMDVLHARSGPEMTVRHLVTNQHFHSIGDRTAQATVSLLAYGGATPADEGPALYPPANAGHIVEVNDHYRLDNGHWKITHRVTRPILSPAPTPATAPD
ncbi:nuclear transport factor 2 family protein [Streptomyces deccanensis]|uniref:nuclear transport factor 2 family protein n=1 Tax=Streptomyces deccanensis TaxID=424188 RepID=UPI001EFB9BF4|nr:nuclear transport factor 2 family protein [Streptomyces deccanensis]ULR55667.1 nuclear transport factor 2 family protein [Streptomyces deccanensis]